MEPHMSEKSGGCDPRKELVTSDREICGGTLVFAGTRVDVESLWNYLAGGQGLDVFLDHFPTVSRDQAVRVIEMAGELFARESHADERTLR